MKTITNNRRAELLAGMAISASLFIGAQSPVVAGEEEPKKDNQGFIEKMERWQDKMSEKFRDAWKSLRGDAKGKSVTAAALDVREDPDNYTVRLHLPDRDVDKMEVKLQGDTLQILEPSGSSTRYEQSLKLSGIAAGAQPKIEREPKDNMIVITVPKGATSDEGKLGSTLPLPSLLPLSDWDRDVFARMEKMRREMDRVFEEGFREFRLGEHKSFFDEPRFGSSVDIKDEGENYVVRAYLPDRDMENVNVTVKDQTLKIEAKAEKEADRKEGERALRSAIKAAYSQLLTLPGPVQSEKMKVEKKQGMLIVTLPKA